MTFTLENFELFFLILVRISGFIYTAPFFSLNNVPNRVKVGFSIFLAAILYYSVPGAMPEYTTTIGFAILVVQEAVAGAIMGLFANISYYILAFSGQIIDMEIGFSMVNELDPTTHIQTTITGNLYGYLIMLMMIITDLHHYILRALVDSFQVIGLGKAVFRPNMYELMLDFMINYFIIAFRIVLPVFAAILLVNTILGILAKVASQLNMFVIGMQLKLFVGLGIMILIIGMVPAVADFIYKNMMEMLKGAIQWMT